MAKKQEKQERQKFSECQSICNMWKVYTRPTCASDFLPLKVGFFKKFFHVLYFQVVLKFCRRPFLKIFRIGGTIQDGGFLTFYFSKFGKNQ
jgi:hypothetical protein